MQCHADALRLVTEKLASAVLVFEESLKRQKPFVSQAASERVFRSLLEDYNKAIAVANESLSAGEDDQ